MEFYHQYLNNLYKISSQFKVHLTHSIQEALRL